MRCSKTIIIIGILVIIFGSIFQFQGRGQIGPQSSFMYQNEDWIDYGYLIIISGMFVIVSGFYLFKTKKL